MLLVQSSMQVSVSQCINSSGEVDPFIPAEAKEGKLLR